MFIRIIIIIIKINVFSLVKIHLCILIYLYYPHLIKLKNDNTIQFFIYKNRIIRSRNKYILEIMQKLLKYKLLN